METHTTEAKWMVLRSAQLSASVFICVDIYLYALLVISFTDTCVLLLVLCRFGLPVSTASTGSSKIAATPATVSCTCSFSVHPQFLLQLLCPPQIPVAASLSTPNSCCSFSVCPTSPVADSLSTPTHCCSFCPPQPTVATSLSTPPPPLLPTSLLLQILCPPQPTVADSVHPSPLLQILPTPTHCCRFCPPQPTVADSLSTPTSLLLQILCPPPHLSFCRFSVHPRISCCRFSVHPHISCCRLSVHPHISCCRFSVHPRISCCRFSVHPNPLLQILRPSQPTVEGLWFLCHCRTSLPVCSWLLWLSPSHQGLSHLTCCIFLIELCQQRSGRGHSCEDKNVQNCI